MTKARGDSMDPLEVEIHHVWSRGVQRAMLLGVDPLTLIDYAERRNIVEELIKHQAGVFAVDVANYSIMGNHLHAVLRSRPDIVANWSDEECAFRYKSAWPTWLDASKEEPGPTYEGRVYQLPGNWNCIPSDQAIECLLEDELAMERVRIFLGSISGFMARVKEPLARLFNKECNVNGSYWAKRFGNRKLESHEEIIGGNIYTDLNHVRANAAASLESLCSGIRLRLLAERAREEWVTENTAQSLERIYRDHVNGSTDVPADQLNAMFADPVVAASL